MWCKDGWMDYGYVIRFFLGMNAIFNIGWGIKIDDGLWLPQKVFLGGWRGRM